MKFASKYFRTFIYNAIFFIFGCMITLSVTQIDSNNCLADKIKQENYKYYKVSQLEYPALIILVISSPNNFERRNTIRETWLTLHSNVKTNIKIKHFFVVGSVGLSVDTMLHLSTEQSKFNDLLILPLEDRYSGLTSKVLQSFVWLHEQINYGLNFSFVLKCDDDTFIRTDKLQKDILTFLPKYGDNIDKNDVDLRLNSSVFSLYSQSNDRNRKRHLYWGYFNGNAKIKSQGKWRETDWMLCDNYVPYAIGGGYVLSKGLVSYLAKNADDLKLFNSEDVSVATWLAPLGNVERLHDIRFNTEWNSRGCLNLYLVSHKISISEMRTMHSNIKEHGKPCLQESQRRKYYLYNWNVLPSNCCTKK